MRPDRRKANRASVLARTSAANSWLAPTDADDTVIVRTERTGSNGGAGLLQPTTRAAKGIVAAQRNASDGLRRTLPAGNLGRRKSIKGYSRRRWLLTDRSVMYAPGLFPVKAGTQSFAACERQAGIYQTILYSRPTLSVDHYENFPVASVLCPPRIRPAVVAIYHFARTADDLADEGTATPSQRLQDLAAFRNDLNAIATQSPPSARWAGVFAELAKSLHRYALPLPHLHALLDAFEQDVNNPYYPTRDSLLQYCARSANPVGRLLLHLYGISDAVALQRADAICSALQLINFWQDLSVDGPRGRHYIPLADLNKHLVEPEDSQRCADTAQTRALIDDLCQWARNLMLQGAPLTLQVPGRAGWELRLVVQGGLRILEKIALMNHAVMLQRPRLTAADGALLVWRAWRMSAAQR